MEKEFRVGGNYTKVTLTKEGFDFVVKVNGIEYKRTPNELFAVQVFNSI